MAQPPAHHWGQFVEHGFWSTSLCHRCDKECKKTQECNVCKLVQCADCARDIKEHCLTKDASLQRSHRWGEAARESQCDVCRKPKKADHLWSCTDCPRCVCKALCRMKVLDEPCSRSAVGGLVSIKFADLAHLRQMWGHSWVFFHLQGSPCFLLLSSTKKAGLTRPSQELVKFNPLAMEKLKLEVADTIDEGKPHARYCASFTLIENSNCVLLFGGKSAGSDLSIYRELWKLCIDLQTSQLRWERIIPQLDQSKSWFQHKAIQPAKRYGHSAVYLRGEVYVFGGFGKKAARTKRPIYSDLWRCTVGGIWEEIKKTSSDEHWPEARGYHSAVTYQDRFLIIYGGSTEADRLLEDLWVYDTTNVLPGNGWSQFSLQSRYMPSPGKLFKHTAAVWCDFMVLVGGKQSNEKPSSLLNALWLFDLRLINKALEQIKVSAPHAPKTFSRDRPTPWIRLDVPGPNVYGHSSYLHERQLNVFGGRFADKRPSDKLVKLNLGGLETITALIGSKADRREPRAPNHQAAGEVLMLRIGSAVSGTHRSEALEILCSLQLQTLLQSTLDNALEDWSLGKDAASTNPAVASSGLVEVLLSSARAAHYLLWSGKHVKTVLDVLSDQRSPKEKLDLAASLVEIFTAKRSMLINFQETSLRNALFECCRREGCNSGSVRHATLRLISAAVPDMLQSWLKDSNLWIATPAGGHDDDSTACLAKSISRIVTCNELDQETRAMLWHQLLSEQSSHSVQEHRLMLHALQLEYDGQSTDKLAGDLRRDVPILVALRAIQDSGVDELIYSKARDQIIDRLKQALDSRDLCLTTSLHLLGRLFSFSELIGEFLGTHPSTVSMMDALNSLGALGAMPDPILNAAPVAAANAAAVANAASTSAAISAVAALDPNAVAIAASVPTAESAAPAATTVAGAPPASGLAPAAAAPAPAPAPPAAPTPPAAPAPAAAPANPVATTTATPDTAVLGGAAAASTATSINAGPAVAPAASVTAATPNVTAPVSSLNQVLAPVKKTPSEFERRLKIACRCLKGILADHLTELDRRDQNAVTNTEALIMKTMRSEFDELLARQKELMTALLREIVDLREELHKQVRNGLEPLLKPSRRSDWEKVLTQWYNTEFVPHTDKRVMTGRQNVVKYFTQLRTNFESFFSFLRDDSSSELKAMIRLHLCKVQDPAWYESINMELILAILSGIANITVKIVSKNAFDLSAVKIIAEELCNMQKKDKPSDSSTEAVYFEYAVKKLTSLIDDDLRNPAGTITELLSFVQDQLLRFGSHVRRYIEDRRDYLETLSAVRRRVREWISALDSVPDLCAGWAMTPSWLLQLDTNITVSRIAFADLRLWGSRADESTREAHQKYSKWLDDVREMAAKSGLPLLPVATTHQLKFDPERAQQFSIVGGLATLVQGVMRENPLKVQLETGETHLSEQELQEAHEAALLCHHVYDETARNTEELEKLCKVSNLRFGGGNTKYLTCMRGETMYVAYRGTTQNIDWLTNLNAAEAFIEDVPVHKGFLSRLDLVWEPIKNAVIGKKRLVFTGHSLGGALAMLSYVRLVKGKDATAELKANVNCFTFGAPLVLRTAAPNATSGVDSTKIHNFVHHYDIVPRILAKIPTRVLQGLESVAPESALNVLRFIKDATYVTYGSYYYIRRSEGGALGHKARSPAENDTIVSLTAQLREDITNFKPARLIEDHSIAHYETILRALIPARQKAGQDKAAP